MVFYVNSEHPRDVLLFYVAGPAYDGTAARIGELVDGWARALPWIVRSPMFVCQEEELLDPIQQKPVLTVGGVLEMYSAHGPWRDAIPREVDEGHFRECLFLVEELTRVSREEGWEFHFEFQGEFVGAIARGTWDEKLGRQFLGSWARALGVAAPVQHLA